MSATSEESGRVPTIGMATVTVFTGMTGAVDGMPSRAVKTSIWRKGNSGSKHYRWTLQALSGEHLLMLHITFDANLGPRDMPFYSLAPPRQFTIYGRSFAAPRRLEWKKRRLRAVNLTAVPVDGTVPIPNPQYDLSARQHNSFQSRVLIDWCTYVLGSVDEHITEFNARGNEPTVAAMRGVALEVHVIGLRRERNVKKKGGVHTARQIHTTGLMGYLVWARQRARRLGSTNTEILFMGQVVMGRGVSAQDVFTYLNKYQITPNKLGLDTDGGVRYRYPDSGGV
ncbi:hypothetical protein C8R46DRAFT_1037747 [Mycena filopes]|nr:hypothetical protein C8R46DRAFT_1037747 [Mycena filopes]